ncbi:MAG: thioredoxin family protein [Gammaproteobacteria bacterium]|nr:thioredoxin family protein [Gammaproteobacteria bacterium]
MALSKIPALLILILPFNLPAVLASTNPLIQSLPIYSTQYNVKQDAFKDGAAAVKLATSSKRRILIELGGDWCKWCHKMDDFFDNNPDIKQKLHETFVMLKINVSDENDNAKFLEPFPKPLGYPHMYVSEFNGSVLWSQDTAEFLKDGNYTRESFLAFFERWNIKNKSPEVKPLEHKK